MSDLGSLRQEGDRYVLRFERRYRHPPEKVWRALVEPAELKQWFPARIEGERRVGARLTFVFEGGEGPTQVGEVRAFEPPRLLEYTWDDELLRFELAPVSGGCRLIFTTTFGARAKAPRDAAGWHLCLEELGRLLGDLREAPTWPALYDAYLREIGLGAWPAFLRHAGVREEAALGVPGLEAHALEGGGGAQLLLCQATRDGQTTELQRDEESYLVVLEGQLSLELGGQQLTLLPGVEFVVPGGSPITLRVRAGTRLLYASVRAPG